ncbi:glycosyltransferase family 8 protein [Sphingobacterium faecium]|uniref:glycosyltransferase family 8 protein n=1 Tax=Sphingobacterium faecium TaxID=34087 RepID=UPI00320B3C29
MQKKTITPLVLAFTPNYVVPAATCIWSILDHSNPSAHYHIICLLTEPLSEDLQLLLQDLDPKRLQFTFLNLKDYQLNIYVDERYTIAASYRLLLPELLPNYDKVIYLDCDIIVRQDLAAVFEKTDLRNNYLAAVYEAALPFQEDYLKSIGSQPGDYFNSGFLIMNLDLLRQDNMAPQFLEASKQQGLQFPDQDVLNQLCKNKTVPLSPIYNGIRTYFLPQYMDDFLKRYSAKEWEEVQKTGTIHYTGAKPWNHFTVKFDIWWHYFDKLPRAIKELNQVNIKMQRLYRFRSFGFGRWVLDPVLTLYRKIKY